MAARRLRTLPAPAPAPARVRPASAHVRWWDPSATAQELVLTGETDTTLRRFLEDRAASRDLVAAGLDVPSRLMFVGPSGVGKTLAARWLGWSLGLPVAVAELAQVVGAHIGDTGRNMTALMAEANAEDSILFLDEVEAITTNRASATGDAGREMARATAAFFQMLDRLPQARIVISATNLPDMLDPALRRRLGTRVDFAAPDAAARRRMIDRWLARADVEESAKVALVAETDGLSGAELRDRAMEVGRRIVLARRKAESEKDPLLSFVNGVRERCTQHDADGVVS